MLLDVSAGNRSLAVWYSLLVASFNTVKFLWWDNSWFHVTKLLFCFVESKSAEPGPDVFRKLFGYVPHLPVVQYWTRSVRVVYVVRYLVHGSRPWQHHLSHDQSAYETRLMWLQCCCRRCCCYWSNVGSVLSLWLDVLIGWCRPSACSLFTLCACSYIQHYTISYKSLSLYSRL